MDHADHGREAASPATDYRSLAPFRAAVTRRRFLQLGGTAAGVTVAAGPQLSGITEATTAAAATKPGHHTGTIADLKHVVILMQENRSFDHYFGSLRGVRGFADKQALKYPNGTTIFEQPDTARTDLGYLLPFHMDSSKVNAQNAGDLDHSWDGDHSARNNGLWNNWVSAKTEQTMGYFTRADIPFQYALADAFTICDGYHQAILGPTSPNRMYFWTGTSGGWTSNPDDYTVEFSGADSITTYPELLQRAGLTWQVYTNHEVGDGGGVDGWVGDYGDNPLWFYQQYQTSENATTAAGQELAKRGAVQPWLPNAGVPLGPNQVNHVLAQFVADATAGTLPQVSWIVAPYEYSEHPAASPSYGAHYVRTVLEALMGNQDLWNSTALFVTYDEHDGYFDHVLPPAPETSVKNEFIDGLPIGFGSRVPMIIASPWTRGGYVDSNTYNHTSMLQFLETWTGVRARNITGWRRSVAGDLTAAFDFARPDFSIPDLPDTVPLITQSDEEESFPPVTTPPAGRAGVPGPGTRSPAPPAEHPRAARGRGRQPRQRPGNGHHVCPREGRRLARGLPGRLPAAYGHPVHGDRGQRQDLHLGHQPDGRKIRLLGPRPRRLPHLVRGCRHPGRPQRRAGAKRRRDAGQAEPGPWSGWRWPTTGTRKSSSLSRPTTTRVSPRPSAWLSATRRPSTGPRTLTGTTT